MRSPRPRRSREEVMMNNATNETSTVHPPITEQINSVGNHLAQSFRTLLDGLPGRPTAAKEMAQTLSVDKILVHNVLRAVRSVDPLATAHSIPGPEPLMRIIKAAKAKGVPADAVRAAEAAVSSFKRLINHEAGDRGGLDAIISTMLPEARGRFETLAKQSVYRGIRQLKGIAANVHLMTTILFSRSDDAARCELASLRGFLGLRCVRPGAAMKIGMITRTANMTSPRLTMDGTPASDPRQFVLTDFCSVPPTEIDVHEKGETIIASLAWGNQVGLRSACDVVTADYFTDALRRWRTPEDRATKSGVHEGVSIPTRTLVFDLLLYDNMYPGQDPRVRIIEMGELGMVSANDDTRELDVLDLDVDMKPMGFGVERFRVKEIPRYVDMLNHVCGKVGADPTRLRGYRTRIEYPVFGTQVQSYIELPVRTTS